MTKVRNVNNQLAAKRELHNSLYCSSCRIRKHILDDSDTARAESFAIQSIHKHFNEFTYCIFSLTKSPYSCFQEHYILI